MTFTTWIASLFAGVWRVVLTPLDTCKTVLQVEGPKGFASLMKKARASSVGAATTHSAFHNARCRHPFYRHLVCPPAVFLESVNCKLAVVS